jgi:AAA family ATP:ADP antiporter
MTAYPAAIEAPEDRGGPLYRLVRRFVAVRPEEVSVLAWAWLYLFSIFFSYYVIRPIRDEIGVAGGVNNLPWLFTGTLIGMMIVNPPYAALVAKLPRVRFISLTYRFFTANLLIFLLLFRVTSGSANLWVGRVFFIWTSVFNLFVVSVFWGFMVDVFNNDQSKRLFGFIAAAATVGGMLGALLTASAVRTFGVSFLLLAAALLLELAVFSVHRLARVSRAMYTVQARPAREENAVVGGGVFAGLTNVLRSPYLLNICLYMFLYTILSTFLYFQQAAIVDRSFTDRAARTAFFAEVDLAVNMLTVGAQFFLTGAVMRRIGVAMTLTLVPALTVFGFAWLALVPSVVVAVVFIVLRRAGNFAFARPSREVLFTVVSREDKYKSKSFIDTVVYRFGDQTGAWSAGALTWLNFGISGIAWAAVPLAAIWVVNGWWLGRRQEARAHAPSGSEPALTPS